ncbi:MAG: aspartate carbamoyltransferase catalytic subunit [Bdellovibrionales bacterium]|nr:aspartate carbamoyltransferase catalytic subunit [Bdellovibrionales bacterium]
MIAGPARFQHLLGIEPLSREDILLLLENSQRFVEVSQRDLKKVPALRGKTIINLFLEPSTRTRASFEIAGKRLSADTINITASGSSVTKGETLLDTARTLQAMNPDILVVRHRSSGAAQFLSERLTKTAVVNAGDGMHEHPTQALLDSLTLCQHFGVSASEFNGKNICIVGDVRHSRVARSNIWAHHLLGNRITLVGPSTLVPREFSDQGAFPGEIRIAHSLREGLESADVVMVLRMQLERQSDNFIPSLEEYTRQYCITEEALRVASPDCVILHPGPANRGIEISSAVYEGSRSLVEKQVNNGVAVRMATLFLLGTRSRKESL